MITRDFSASFTRNNTKTTTTIFRAFQGSESKQLDGVSGDPLEPASWYVEPSDYDGDVAWAGPFASADEAWAFVEQQIPA